MARRRSIGPNSSPDALFPELIPRPRRNRNAIERTIRALRAAERLDEIDTALIAAVRTTAAALDDAPNPYVVATVARIHVEGIRLLAGKPAPEGDEIDSFLRSLMPAAVRDSPDA
jgi:hypothetical protein